MLQHGGCAAHWLWTLWILQLGLVGTPKVQSPDIAVVVFVFCMKLTGLQDDHGLVQPRAWPALSRRVVWATAVVGREDHGGKAHVAFRARGQVLIAT